MKRREAERGAGSRVREREKRECKTNAQLFQMCNCFNCFYACPPECLPKAETRNPSSELLPNPKPPKPYCCPVSITTLLWSPCEKCASDARPLDVLQVPGLPLIIAFLLYGLPAHRQSPIACTYTHVYIYIYICICICMLCICIDG